MQVAYWRKPSNLGPRGNVVILRRRKETRPSKKVQKKQCSTLCKSTNLLETVLRYVDSHLGA